MRGAPYKSRVGRDEVLFPPGESTGFPSADDGPPAEAQNGFGDDRILEARGIVKPMLPDGLAEGFPSASGLGLFGGPEDLKDVGGSGESASGLCVVGAGPS